MGSPSYGISLDACTAIEPLYPRGIRNLKIPEGTMLAGIAQGVWELNVVAAGVEIGNGMRCRCGHQEVKKCPSLIRAGTCRNIRFFL